MAFPLLLFRPATGFARIGHTLSPCRGQPGTGPAYNPEHVYDPLALLLGGTALHIRPLFVCLRLTRACLVRAHPCMAAPTYEFSSPPAAVCQDRRLELVSRGQPGRGQPDRDNHIDQDERNGVVSGPTAPNQACAQPFSPDPALQQDADPISVWHLPALPGQVQERIQSFLTCACSGPLCQVEERHRRRP